MFFFKIEKTIWRFIFNKNIYKIFIENYIIYTYRDIYTYNKHAYIYIYICICMCISYVYI